ncbi:MAG TPA: metallophosphoesterase, partial [Alphaproteobacteria bacterium]|nr:metallophosphoesterase [Alphaproteobacteria bacterium]
FAAARAFLGRIHQPVLAIPGNHDIPLHNLLERWLRPHARFSAFIGPDCCPRYADAEIAVVGLNTASRRLDRGGGRATRAHIDAIHEGFDDLPASLFRVLVTHHPLLDPTDGSEIAATRDAGPVLDAIAGAGVALLLAGHHHRPFSAEGTIDYLNVKRSLLIVLAGTAVSTRLRGGSNSFNLVAIDGTRVDCTPYAWESGGFRAEAAVRFELTEGRWKTLTPIATHRGTGRRDF